jgi:hypothetical protein
MTLTIQLEPETESRLEQEAAKHGVNASEYARLLIERSLPSERSATASLWETLAPEEWIRQTREWIDTHRDWPVLPPEAYERASFYEGRE